MKRIIISLGISFALLLGGINALPAYAQTNTREACEGAGGTFSGGQCNFQGGGTLEGSFRNIINTLIFIVGAVAVLMLIIGAIRFTLSAGDENAVKGARNTMLYAIVGIVVAFLAFAIVNFVLERLAAADTQRLAHFKHKLMI